MPARPPVFRPTRGAGSEAARRDTAAAYDRRRRAESATRALYGTARWQSLRARQLAEEPLCRFCRLFDRIEPAVVCDHVVPHGGDVDRFWIGPFQSLCRHCHSAQKQREERAQRPLDEAQEARRFPQDLAPSRLPLTIVCGAPGSGKSSYVRARQRPGDPVIDLDAIMARLSGLPEHHTHLRWLPDALEERNCQLRALASASGDGAAWFIIGAPNPEERDRWRAMLGASLVVLATPLDECCRRIRADPARAGLEERMIWAAIAWWSQNADL